MVLSGDKWKAWDQKWGPQETGVEYRFCVYLNIDISEIFLFFFSFFPILFFSF